MLIYCLCQPAVRKPDWKARGKKKKMLIRWQMLKDKTRIKDGVISDITAAKSKKALCCTRSLISDLQHSALEEMIVFSCELIQPYGVNKNVAHLLSTLISVIHLQSENVLSLRVLFSVIMYTKVFVFCNHCFFYWMDYYINLNTVPAKNHSELDQAKTGIGKCLHKILNI